MEFFEKVNELAKDAADKTVEVVEDTLPESTDFER